LLPLRECGTFILIAAFPLVPGLRVAGEHDPDDPDVVLRMGALHRREAA
jgi:hypothetical protein